MNNIADAKPSLPMCVCVCVGGERERERESVVVEINNELYIVS